MFFWKSTFGIACLLLLSVAARASDFQIAAWRAAYDAELHGDVIATHNALLRLKGYRRFGLISLTEEQERQIDHELAQLILPKPVVFAPETIANVAGPVALVADEPKRRKKKATAAPRKNRRSLV